MHASSVFRLPISIQSTVCSPDPEQRVLDGWQDSRELPPFMQYEPLCRTTQHLESRNRQSNCWKSSHKIPRDGYILLQVLQRLKVGTEDELLPCLFLFGTFLCLCSGFYPCLFLYLAGKGENHPSESHHCLLTSLPCLCVFWSTKQSPLQFRILCLLFFRLFWKHLCVFLFPFLFFFSPGSP